MLTVKRLDSFILLLMFALLPVDMINGILLHNDVTLPLTVAQLYKLGLLGALFFSFLINIRALLISLSFIAILMLPTLIQMIVQRNVGLLLYDFIKISRYLTPMFSFLFFVKVINRGNQYNVALLFKLVKFSYIVFTTNILIKYLGLGYPMYKFADVGSKGFFFAGNETSALLIILSAILGYNILKKSSKRKYYLFFIFNLFVGLSISSKTGTMGILLTFILLPMKRPRFSISLKRLKYIFISLFVGLPLLLAITWRFIEKSAVYARVDYFWRKLDFWTFVFSNRNNFFKDAWQMYIRDYNLVEKFFGVGQKTYERLNGDSIVEIDFADIFFAYGLMGVMLFCMVFFYIWYELRRLKKARNHPYLRFVSLMILLLLGISTIAGHVFSSGMSAVFIGLLFSLMYIKDDDEAGITPV